MLDYLGFPHGETEVGKFIGTVDRDPDGKTARQQVFASVSCMQMYAHVQGKRPLHTKRRLCKKRQT